MNFAAFVKGNTPHDSRYELQCAFIYAGLICVVLMYRASVGSIRELTFITMCGKILYTN